MTIDSNELLNLPCLQQTFPPDPCFSAPPFLCKPRLFASI
jgi:hypothetical protein